MSDSVLIIGAGQAGAQAAAALRSEGFRGEITLIGDEPHLPYQRPPLSKGLLLGKHGVHQTTWRPASFYESNRITLRLGAGVVALDRAAQRAVLADGTRLPYDHLILATGTHPRRLAIPGGEDPRVVYLRNLADAEALRAKLATARNLVVIGGGFVGLEVAASASALGISVTVLEAQERLMARSVARITSEAVRHLHERRGVEILLGSTVSAILGGARLQVVGSGPEREADLVLAGIGALAHDRLATEAGLETANGILVDARGRTVDPAIYAIGDCAVVADPTTGRRLRLESVQNAVDQGRAVAALIMGLAPTTLPVPWFWSDQYDTKLQIAGVADSDAETEIPRGDVTGSAFSVFRYAGQSLAAVDSINMPADHMIARRLLATGLSPAPEVVGDAAADLRRLALVPAS
jgi:3-phenylpropionate/trans-cinnamate dioxygenase ferredoxin reductase subunit